MKRKEREQTKTRRINPKLSILGLLGFLGFLGIPAFKYYGMIYPFAFFGFFGFFGFYFEGKMSNTFMDERYRENRTFAEHKAYKTGIICMWFLLFAYISGLCRVFVNLEYVAIYFVVGMSIVFAFTIFYQEYLLYRNDSCDQVDEVDEENE